MIRCPECRESFSIDEMPRCPGCGREYTAGNDVLSFLAEDASVGEEYRDQYFDVNDQREDRHFWFVGRNAVARRLVQRYARLGMRMIEIGCGTGNMLDLLSRSGWHVDGLDMSRHALRFAAKKTSARLFQADITDLPFEHEYDAVGMFDVLEHIEDDAAALDNVHRALRPGGLLFLTVPAGASLFSDYDRLLCHRRRYDPGALLGLVRAQGFEVLKATRFFFFLYPLFWLNRRLRKQDAGQVADPQKALEKELAVIPVLNDVFKGVMFLESLLVARLNFPMGSSIALVARKKNGAEEKNHG